MPGRSDVCARSAHVGAELTPAQRRFTIGVDGSRATSGQPTGTERYSIELLSEFARLDPPESFLTYLNTASAPTELRVPGGAVLLPGARFWTLRHLAAEMRRNPPDLLFVPAHVIPPVHPKSVVTVHDLGYLAEPECHEPLQRKQLHWATKWNCRAASGIIAVSESTRQDLIQHLGVDPARVAVVHHGVAASYTPSSSRDIDSVRAKYGLGKRFILAVGSIHPRKNLVRLIDAFESIALRDREIRLVLCGRALWRAHETFDRIARSPHRDRIVHLGYVAGGDMPALYSAAAVTAIPSLYEGFGFPAIESMRCGTPVVAADRSSLPEICGQAAVRVDPHDTASIAGGIERLLTDEETRNQQIELGIQRAQSFTWEKCALQTLAFLRSIGDNSD